MNSKAVSIPVRQRRRAVSDAHSLAPFNVVYANPADPTPARIYFYDSNYPNVDTAFMTIGNGGRSFTYDFLHADVSLPLVPLP
jgi:hypothetical protein